jgi:uncharacterized protein YcaQ
MRSATIQRAAARRLAVARAGLLRPERTGLPTRAAGSGARARGDAHAVVRRFGYLQLDSVVISGARSHSLVLMSRLDGMGPAVGENLLAPGEPLFEYWGHEASWLPMELYPAFEFRRREFRRHPWWGDLLAEHRPVADALLHRIGQEGPRRSSDLSRTGGDSGNWWGWSVERKVLSALWSAGDLAISRRVGFLREYDLTERVIPAWARDRTIDLDEALRLLLLRALSGHGWATTSTLSATWRLRGLGAAVKAALGRLVEEGEVVPCRLHTGSREYPGWIRPGDLALAEQLQAARPRRDRGLLLSPFDPLLWDRARVKTLFDFEQLLEIYKPAAQRRYGYYCLPVLAGDRLIGRVDLRAVQRRGCVELLAAHAENPGPPSRDRRAIEAALQRHSDALQLNLTSLEALAAT